MRNCLPRLMRESSIQSRKAGEKNISPNSVRKVTEVCLLEWTSRVACHDRG